MKMVFISITVVDDEKKKEWSSVKKIPYHAGDVNQVNFARFDRINQVLYCSQEAFREIVEKVESEDEK